jgi:hypothetical protein
MLDSGSSRSATMLAMCRMKYEVYERLLRTKMDILCFGKIDRMSESLALLIDEEHTAGRRQYFH